VDIATVLLNAAARKLFQLGQRKSAFDKRAMPHVNNCFIAALGIMLAVLFALVISVQGVAGIVFNGCER
jgi:hypothetical protein